MKGIIFNLVEEAITARYGEDTWEAVLESADLDGSYTSLGSYPDEDLTRLVAAGAEALGVDARQLTREVGHEALIGLARRYPQYFEPFDTTRPFLLTLNDVIHPEVRKLHPGTDPPDFWFDVSDAEALTIHYRSVRRLCALAEGMITGAATHFGEQVTLTHEQCMLDGADHCILLAETKQV